MAAMTLDLRSYDVWELEAEEAVRAEAGAAQLYLGVRILKVLWPYIQMGVSVAAASWGARQANN